MRTQPNIVFLFADQLRALELPLYGGTQIETPNIDRLARQGVSFTNAISTCPVCTPFRSMLLTGRHPQTTGHIVNFMRTRHDEISIADAFANAGYRSAWVGKWHLHTGSFPQIDGPDYVPEGRDRLGFHHWRGYNFHTNYFNGSVNLDDWHWQQWDGYETEALNRYAFEFMDQVGDDPFLLFLSPHQPHYTPFDWAPEAYYERVPEKPEFPANVPDELKEGIRGHYRHYLAMTLAVDAMLGELMAYLDRTGKAENTLLVFSSDHGTQMGGHGDPIAFGKKQPYEESILIPFIARLPGVFEGGSRCDSLIAPVDIFPSLCSLCGVPIPRTVEGRDLTKEWCGAGAGQDAVLLMNFTNSYDYPTDGKEWRGVRTRTHTYARWLDGKVVLYDLESDPEQLHNLADDPSHQELRESLEATLQERMAAIGDKLVPCSSYANWFDEQRRVVRNAHGSLGDPELPPDWSMLC